MQGRIVHGDRHAYVVDVKIPLGSASSEAETAFPPFSAVLQTSFITFVTTASITSPFVLFLLLPLL